jgi:NADH-ubiquinone oxidoreductase chain 5
MTISICLSGLAFFPHLSTHALFKALFFTCAGGVIHSIGDSQDICFIGVLSVYIPFTSILMVSSFALCGMPFLAGFYSKDFILEMFPVWMTGMHTRQSSTQNNKYQVSQKYSCFSCG